MLSLFSDGSPSLFAATRGPHRPRLCPPCHPCCRFQPSLQLRRPRLLRSASTASGLAWPFGSTSRPAPISVASRLPCPPSDDDLQLRRQPWLRHLRPPSVASAGLRNHLPLPLRLFVLPSSPHAVSCPSAPPPSPAPPSNSISLFRAFSVLRLLLRCPTLSPPPASISSPAPTLSLSSGSSTPLPCSTSVRLATLAPAASTYRNPPLRRPDRPRLSLSLISPVLTSDLPSPPFTSGSTFFSGPRLRLYLSPPSLRLSLLHVPCLSAAAGTVHLPVVAHILCIAIVMWLC